MNTISTTTGSTAEVQRPDFMSMDSMLDKQTAWAAYCGCCGDQKVSEVATKLKDTNALIKEQGEALALMRRIKNELGTDNDKDKACYEYFKSHPEAEYELNKALKEAGWAPFPKTGALGKLQTDDEIIRSAIEQMFKEHGQDAWALFSSYKEGSFIPYGAAYRELTAKELDNAVKLFKNPGTLLTNPEPKAEKTPLDATYNKVKAYYWENRNALTAQRDSLKYPGGVDGTLTRRALAEKLDILEQEQKAKVQEINEVMSELSTAIQHQGNNWERLSDLIKKLGDLLDSILGKSA